MSMRRRRVLVVYKQDAFTQYVEQPRDATLRRLLRQGHPDVLDMQRAHRTHRATLEAVIRVLQALPVTFDVAARAHLKDCAPYDLVISVGGDGTFLQAARHVPRTPILGVNSDPQRSEAVFSAATRRTFPALCRQALEGRLPELRLLKLQLKLNGVVLPQRAINDALICHEHPATMSRYRLRLGRREELQKSSGVWVATAAGSSSAVLAAGGRRTPWQAPVFQYRPRELYHGRLSHPRLRGGVLSKSARLRVTWLMRHGAAFIDGPHVMIPLRFADQLEMSLSLEDPLRVMGLRPSRRR